MENGTSLDDILNDEPGTTEAPQLETIEQPRDENGRFAPKTGEEQQEPEVSAPAPEAPPTSEPEPAHIPMAALKDERTKRQQAEAEKAALEQQLQQYAAYFAQLEQQSQQPDVEEDPVAFIAAQVQQQVMPQVQQQVMTARVEMTEALARQKWQDYDEKVELFKAEAHRNPYLVQELMKAPNPAEYAYQVSTQIAEARQFGTPNPSREQMMAQLREELKAELGLAKPQVPTSLANERSVGSRSGPAWSGPTPLGDLLG